MNEIVVDPLLLNPGDSNIVEEESHCVLRFTLRIGQLAVFVTENTRSASPVRSALTKGVRREGSPSARSPIAQLSR